MKRIIDIPEYAYERIKEYYDALPDGGEVDANLVYIAESVQLDSDSEIPNKSVIDKIKAEIKQEYNDAGFDDYDYASGLNRALHIIDKYTAQEGEQG